MRFLVTMLIEVDEGGNLLSTTPKYYSDDVVELLQDQLRDVDDMQVLEIQAEQE